MAIHATGRAKIETAISGRTPFRHASMQGTNELHGVTDFGRLPVEFRTSLRDLPGPVYVVWSYATPIAWHTDETGWVVPETTYSRTTNDHQRIVRQSVSFVTL